MMKIVVDAMGSDERPTPDVEGAIAAAREYRDTIILVGDERQIQRELAKHDTQGLPIEVVHADEEILMHDKPSAVMKQKSGSSMHVGMNLVKDGQADGFVTMGNTGAAHAIATLRTLRRISGVKRPALTAIYPINDRNVIYLDIGANADSKVEWLVRYAVMGSAYAHAVLKYENPRVGTLSNGEEEGKGNQLIRAVQERLQTLDLNYVGHVEPAEVTTNKVDVVVTDGFVGNVFIKTFEATLRYMTSIIREEIRNDLVSTAGGLLSRPAFRRVRDRIDPREIGGAPLLGVNGVVIIGHGSSDAKGVKGAINQARLAVQGHALDEMKAALEQIGS